MAIIILIFGLPGSGKTTLAKSMIAMDKFPEHTLFLDDLSLNPSMVNQFDPTVHSRIIIADPMLCEAKAIDARRLCNKWWPGTEFNFKSIYFENDPVSCTINALRDPKPGGTTNMIKILTKVYFIPDGADVRPVYKEPNNGQEISA